MSSLQLGYAFALGTAVSWAAAVILFKKSSSALDPLALNVFKTVIGLVLLLVTGLVVGFEGVSRDPLVWLALAASGSVGIGIADTLLFKGLNLIGAARMAVVDALYTPMVMLLAYLLHGEQLTPEVGGGGALILSGVALASYAPAGDLPIERPRFLRGVAYSATAVSLMALAIVLIKPLLAGHGVLWCTTTRVTGALIVMSSSLLLRPVARARVLSAFRPQPSWRFAVPGAVTGSYLSLLLWIGAFKHAPSGTAALLNQTASLFVVVLAAIFLNERLTPRLVCAVLLAAAGSSLVLI